MKLTKAQKVQVDKWAIAEAAELLALDWGDPFKHRSMPDRLAEELGDDDEANQLADELFFDCVAKLAKRLRKEAKS